MFKAVDHSRLMIEGISIIGLNNNREYLDPFNMQNKPTGNQTAKYTLTNTTEEKGFNRFSPISKRLNKLKART